MSVEMIYLVLFCLGVAYSAQALVFVVGREISPSQLSGTAMATINMMVMLGGMFLQPVVGFILDFVWDGQIVNGLHVYSSLDYQKALSILPIGILLSGFLSFFVKETYGTFKDTQA